MKAHCRFMKHTVGPMRAGAIFVNDLSDADLLQKVGKIRISLYGSLAATGEGHMTPSALLLGLEGESCETIDTAIVPVRFEEIKSTKQLHLGGKVGKAITFDYEKDFIFEYGRSLPLHSNGMRLTVFDKEGTMLATNDLFSVGGGFVVNGALSTATSTKAKSASSSAHPIDLEENIYYKEIKRSDAANDRRVGIDTSQTHLQNQPAQIEDESSSSLPTSTSGSSSLQSTISNQPPYPFRDAKSLLALCQQHNLTIAQLVYENERHWYTDAEIRQKLTNIWLVMDNCIREGVHSQEEILPGSLRLKRRAPGLYKRLTRGLYPSLEKPSTMQKSASIGGVESQVTKTGQDGVRTSLSASKGPPRVHGSFNHPILPTPPRRTMFPTMDHLTVYAMAVNEVNACGGRVVTAPTNGAVSVSKTSKVGHFTDISLSFSTGWHHPSCSQIHYRIHLR
jgi:L-serine deaminase